MINKSKSILNHMTHRSYCSLLDHRTFVYCTWTEKEERSTQASSLPWSSTQSSSLSVCCLHRKCPSATQEQCRLLRSDYEIHVNRIYTTRKLSDITLIDTIHCINRSKFIPPVYPCNRRRRSPTFWPFLHSERMQHSFEASDSLIK